MISIVVKYQCEGLHHYPGAPAGVSFLKSLHRHVFHITARIEVTHTDRELEIIKTKHNLTEITNQLLNGTLPRRYLAETLGLTGTEVESIQAASTSCELLAKAIRRYIKAQYGDWRAVQVEVLEDGENGSVVDDAE